MIYMQFHFDLVYLPDHIWILFLCQIAMMWISDFENMFYWISNVHYEIDFFFFGYRTFRLLVDSCYEFRGPKFKLMKIANDEKNFVSIKFSEKAIGEPMIENWISLFFSSENQWSVIGDSTNQTSKRDLVRRLSLNVDFK